ncbi:hypothetical protein NtRootA9_34470 [Arthrobacter sp. NtRootA9]|nr:hypothetical protein NtRootA9_34470 [Arthrobacter sp. NtRootA9]
MSDTAGTRSEGFVDQLLADAGMDDDSQLRPALLQLRALGNGVPEPSPAVAALLQRAGTAVAAENAAPAADNAAPAMGTDQLPAPLDELAARRRAKRRAALTALALGVSLTAGGAVAAASDQGIRDSFTKLNHAVTLFVTGSGPAAEPDPSPAPAQPAAPAPAGPAGPGSVPTAPPVVEAPAAAPPSDVPAAPRDVPSQGGHSSQPADVPGSAPMPSVLPPEVTDKLPQRPQVPLPETPQLPLPTTVPAVPRQ